jgi:two-component system, NarL family, sensor histidine kinase BarA
MGQSAGEARMARDRFYRLLGETSLELKCLALFGGFLLLVITANFFSYWLNTETVVKEQNPITARLLVVRTMLSVHFKAMAREGEGRDQRFLQFAKSFDEQLKKDNYGIRFISPDPRIEHEKPQGDFERQILAGFAKETPEEIRKPGRVGYKEGPVTADNEYQYFQEIRFEKNCLGACHQEPPRSGLGTDIESSPYGRGPPPGQQRWNEGDLMAVVRVTIPNGPMQDKTSLYWNVLLAIAVVTLFLAMIAFLVTIRYLIARPLKHLRDVSDAISHGNMALRAEINTGDEFESLGVAFNRMLRHLMTVQDELRQVNADLDGKVDELAQVNMQLYEMNRIKSDFMATMSHELRTPLNSILGFSDVLCSIDSLDEKQKRYVTNIQKSGRMLLEMINNILDLAKIESGKMEIRLTEFSIEHVVAAQCDMARPLTEKRNIDLNTEVQPELPPMFQDQARVQQILNNLLSNAIKFTPEGGRILVTAQRSEENELVMRVIDTGVGIAAEDQQLIFEKFRQGRTAMPGGDAMTREYSGTGLGLSIIKELCKLLGGEVSVESELGTGSAFTVRLPWHLEKQPRLESPLATGFQDFAKARFESAHRGPPEEMTRA